MHITKKQHFFCPSPTIPTPTPTPQVPLATSRWHMTSVATAKQKCLSMLARPHPSLFASPPWVRRTIGTIGFPQRSKFPYVRTVAKTLSASLHTTFLVLDFIFLFFKIFTDPMTNCILRQNYFILKLTNQDKCKYLLPQFELLLYQNWKWLFAHCNRDVIPSCSRRVGIRRHGAGPSRLCCQVLHGRGQLGPDWQQHPYFLHQGRPAGQWLGQRVHTFARCRPEVLHWWILRTRDSICLILKLPSSLFPQK